MESSLESRKLEYTHHVQKQQQRIEQGLPPIGPANCVKKLSQDFSSDPKFKSHGDSFLKEELRVGDIHLRSTSPTFPYEVILIDDGEVAYFYASADDGSEDDSILDALQIYNTQELTDQDRPHMFEIMWSIDGLKVALLINKYIHAVFDFETFRGYCRTNFPPVSPDASFGEYAHDWLEECTKCFL